MKIATIFIAVAALISASSGHAEDVTAAFAKCANTLADKQRLACFDAIKDKSVSDYKRSLQPVGTYQEINLLDLKLDISSMTGKKIAASGLLQQMGDTLFLKTEAMDMSPVWIGMGKLSRDDRKKILKDCMTICMARITGTVQPQPLGLGVTADSVVLK